MANIPIFVGFDCHQSKIQVCVEDESGSVLTNGFCDNDWQAVRKRVRKLGRVAGVAIEACSGAANLADELIAFAKWPVHLAHPGYVARMKQSPDKSDFTDARMLADLERVGYLPRVWLAPEAIRELRMLVGYRQQLVNERRSTKLRIGAVLREQRLRESSHS
ncbi:MAG: transposase, partial [bacterium]